MDLQHAALFALIWAVLVAVLCAFMRGHADAEQAEWMRGAGIDVKRPAAAEVSA